MIGTKLMRVAKTLKAVDETINLVQEWFSIEDMLYRDLATYQTELVRDRENQRARRAFIRAAFAYIEANIFTLKEIALMEAQLKDIELTRAETAFLLEETYQLEDTGSATIKGNYSIRISPNVRFIFKVHSRLLNKNLELDVTEPHWNHFQRAVKVRNRITHPRSNRDIEVSDDDLTDAVESFTWLKHKFRPLFIHANEVIDAALRSHSIVMNPS